jgi:zinc protease
MAVNYLVGSDEAPEGFPGMAHAQEHMMFRGSPGLSADQLAEIGSAMGGDFNADTREGLTQYLYTVPAEDVDTALHIEAIRMQGVLDTQADWDLERGAIEQEVAGDHSDPFYVLSERLRAAMFAGTPYAHDALGTRPSFDKATAAMLREFHDKWYAPNNAILVVVGDVDPDVTLAETRKLFGGIAPKVLPPRPQFQAKPIRAQSIAMNTDQPEATQVLAIRLPGLDSPDFPALEVLSDVLNNHRFALYGLVPQGKAVGAGFELDPLPHAALGYAVVTYPPGEDAKSLEQDVRTILTAIARDGVPADLVAAAKLQETAQAEFQKNSIEGLASVWSDAVALYGLKSPDDDLKRIEKVTVADVDRVARKYLDLDQAISAVMTPSASGQPVSSSSGFGGQESIALGQAKPTPLPDWAEAALGRLTVPRSTIDPVVSTLPNGIKLIVQPEDVSDTVMVFGHVRNRPQTETAPGKEGVDDVLSDLLQFGTTHLDRLAFQQALDQIGAQESAGTDFAVKVLAADFDRGVELLADNELHPALPQPAFDILKRQAEQAVAARNVSPNYLVFRAARTSLFPPGDPSLRDSTPQTIAPLTLDDVRRYYQTVYRPDLTTIVVIGKVTPQNARDVIGKYFGGWTAAGPKPQTDLPPAPANRRATVAVPDSSREQDEVLLGQNLAITRADPDYFALNLGNEVLAGGFYTARLSQDLRKKSGLVYSVASELEPGRSRSVYFVQYACDPPNVSKAAAIVKRDIRGMQTTTVPADELDQVKALLIRRIPLSNASVDEIAHGLTNRVELELPLDEPAIAARHYMELGPADVEAAFKKWMRPGDLIQVSQGPPPK